jgi:hypothetical protein
VTVAVDRPRSIVAWIVGEETSYLYRNRFVVRAVIVRGWAVRSAD